MNRRAIANNNWSTFKIPRLYKQFGSLNIFFKTIILTFPGFLAVTWRESSVMKTIMGNFSGCIV